MKKPGRSPFHSGEASSGASRLARMHTYSILGATLASDLAFPGLAEGFGGPPRWTLETRSQAAPVGPTECIGSAEVDPTISVHLLTHDEGYRLVYDDTGTFDISRDGGHIAWTPTPDAKPELARLDVIGRVLALALHAQGTFTAHASAVCLADGAVGFLGPKFHGKSSLAAAMTRSGARLLTDDMLPVEVRDGGAWAAPGVHSVRLWHDSLERAWSPDPNAPKREGKQTVTHLPPEQLAGDPQPLRALYLLSPSPPESGTKPAQRERMDSVRSALILVAHAKLGPLLHRAESDRLLQRATEIASHVPVYRLSVMRDFDRLDEVVEQVTSWLKQDVHESASVPGLGKE